MQKEMLGWNTRHRLIFACFSLKQLLFYPLFVFIPLYSSTFAPHFTYHPRLLHVEQGQLKRSFQMNLLLILSFI